jgi:hypothetical protein
MKSPCVHCSNNIEYPAESTGEIIPCPHCGKSTPLKPVVALPPPPPGGVQPVAGLGPETPKQYLVRIRGQSSYAMLRQLIDIVSVVFGAIGAFFVVAGLAAGSMELDEARLLSAFLGSLGCFIIGAGIICLVIALRQASLVVVDMADMQIEANRRKQAINL